MPEAYELITRAGIDPGRIEDVIIGCASLNAEQGANVAAVSGAAGLGVAVLVERVAS